MKPQTPSDLKIQFLAQTEQFLDHCQRQLELARARGNREQQVREQIKMEVMKAAQQMFHTAEQLVRRKGEAHENP